MSPSARRARIIVALLAVAGVAAVALAAETPTITKENAFTFYRGYKRLTDQSRSVSPEIARLCVNPDAATVAAEESRKGPHALAYVHLYVNAAAADVVEHGSRSFPPGAVVIKEKVSSGDEPPRAVGGMIKHAPGYDPEHGDWEYFYCEKDGVPTSGRLANCAACHAGAKATDYVFSVWNPDRAPAR